MLSNIPAVPAGVLAAKALQVAPYYVDTARPPKDVTVDPEITVTVFAPANKQSVRSVNATAATVSGEIIGGIKNLHVLDFNDAKKLKAYVKAAGRDNARVPPEETDRGSFPPTGYKCRFSANAADALGKPSTKGIYGKIIGAPQGMVGAETLAILDASVSAGIRLRADLAAQAEILKNLKPGWDGYGAAPIAAAVVNRIVRDVTTALAGTTCSAPELVPGGDGSVQAEWNSPSIEVTYNVNDHGELYFWAYDRKAGVDLARTGDEAQAALRAWAEMPTD